MDNLVCFQAGLDHEGKGRIYGYDPVGCVEELNQCSGGAGVTLMQSLLDNQVKNFVESAMFCFSSIFFVSRTAFSYRVNLIVKDMPHHLGLIL